MKSHSRKIAIGLVAASVGVLATSSADAGLFRKRPIIVVTPAPVVVAAPVERTVYAAPVATVTETRAVYSAPVVVADPVVTTSYRASTVVSAPARTTYLAPTVFDAPAAYVVERPVRVIVPRRVYRFPY